MNKASISFVSITLFLTSLVGAANVQVDRSKILLLNAYPDIAREILTQGKHFVAYTENPTIKDLDKRKKLTEKSKELKHYILEAKKDSEKLNLPDKLFHDVEKHLKEIDQHIAKYRFPQASAIMKAYVTAIEKNVFILKWM